MPAAFALEVVGGIRSPPQSLVKRDGHSGPACRISHGRFARATSATACDPGFDPERKTLNFLIWTEV